jgi:hypothetical protein
MSRHGSQIKLNEDIYCGPNSHYSRTQGSEKVQRETHEYATAYLKRDGRYAKDM